MPHIGVLTLAMAIIEDLIAGGLLFLARWRIAAILVSLCFRISALSGVWLAHEQCDGRQHEEPDRQPHHVRRDGDVGLARADSLDGCLVVLGGHAVDLHTELLAQVIGQVIGQWLCSGDKVIDLLIWDQGQSDFFRALGSLVLGLGGRAPARETAATAAMATVDRIRRMINYLSRSVCRAGTRSCESLNEMLGWQVGG